MVAQSMRNAKSDSEVSGTSYRWKNQLQIAADVVRANLALMQWIRSTDFAIAAIVAIAIAKRVAVKSFAKTARSAEADGGGQSLVIAAAYCWDFGEVRQSSAANRS